ncbi:MAG: uracil-DNA glycosylase [Defluviitaleaceae bacterium]|nr:uracil-DNA glycosylase [Defluviitaleaceae bacterium]
MVQLNNDWDEILAGEFEKDYYLQLREFLKNEYRSLTVYPGMFDIFNALKLTSFGDVKVVIVGQDPYINPGEAHGLAFSVLPGAKTPPSLQNIFKELATDIGCTLPNNGHLVHWANQGVLLLNNVLTVRAKASRSHAGRGWEIFTAAVLEKLNQRKKPLVAMLWGNDAKAKGQIFNNPQHLVLQAAHPSPLAGGKFFGCRHFSRANEFLAGHGIDGIDWQIPNV